MPKLSDGQKEQLKIILKERDNWTTEEVREVIFREFDVEYTPKQIRIILKKFKMNHAKPYPHDYRRPKDAEDLLKNLPEMNEDSIIGFLDETETLVFFRRKTNDIQKYDKIKGKHLWVLCFKWKFCY